MKYQVQLSILTAAASVAAQELPLTATGSGPKCVETYDEDVDYFPTKITGAQFASDTWDVTYQKNYKVIKNMNPDDPTALPIIMVATQCGTPTPSLDDIKTTIAGWDSSIDLDSLVLDPAGKVTAEQTLVSTVAIPIITLAATSTTQIEYLDQLNVRNNMVVYAGNCQYISNTCIQARFPASDTAISETNPFVCTEAAWGESHNFYTTEGIDTAKIPVDATFYGGYGVTTADFDPAYAETNGQGVQIPILDDYANTLASQGGITGLYSLYLNEEAVASNLFIDGVEPRLNCVTSNAQTYAATLDQDLTVLWASRSDYCGAWPDSYQGWSITACGEYHTEVVEDAGATLLCKEEAGFCFATDEEFIEFAKNADVWIYADGTNWEATYTANADAMDQLTSVQNQAVYDTSLSGQNNWFESRLSNPDVLTEDINDVVLGPINGQFKYNRVFLRDVFNQPRGTPPACTDPSDQLPWVSPAGDCVAFSVDNDDNDDLNASGSAAGVAFGAIAGALAVAMM